MQIFLLIFVVLYYLGNLYFTFRKTIAMKISFHLIISSG